MFKNNNMGFIKKIALNDLKNNKLKTFLSGIVIMISTCLLVTIVLVSYNGSVDLVNKSPYHVTYQSVDKKIKNKLKQNPNFSDIGIYKIIGEKIKSDYRMYVMYADATSIKFMNFQPIQGRLPTNKNEIAISEKSISEMGLSKNIGDEITLTYNDKITNKEVQGDFIIVGFLQNYYKDKSREYYTILSSDYINHNTPSDSQNGSTNFSENKQNTVNVLGKLTKENLEKTSTEIKQQLKKIGFSLGIEKHNISLNNVYIEGILINGREIIMLLILAIVILFSSVFVVYSIFYISVVNSVQMYAKLKSFGMTSKQLKKMISLQGNILSFIFIPIGLICSCIIAYLVQPLAWKTSIDLLIVIIFGIIMFFTVKISIYKPAKIISNISTIKAMLYTENFSKNKVQSLEYVNPTNLALKNIKINRKKNLIALISLSISSILFISIATLANSIDFNKQLEPSFIYSEDYTLSVKTDNLYEQITKIQQNNPLTNTLKTRIKNIDGVKQVIESKEVKSQLISPLIHDKNGDEIISLIKSITPELSKSFQQYFEKGKINYEQLNNDSLIINSSRMKYSGIDLDIGDVVTFNIFSGDDILKKQMKIVGIIDNPNSGYTFFASNKAFDSLGAYNTNLNFSILCDKQYLNDVGKELLNIVQENSNLELNSYQNEYEMTTRVFKYMVIISYVFIALITCFGILNMSNILINSVLIRKKEFALLQAVGMTNIQLRKMLYREGLDLSIKAVCISIVLGFVGSKALCVFMKDVIKLDFIDFHFSILPIIAFTIILISIQILISELLVRNIGKNSLTERLRTQ